MTTRYTEDAVVGHHRLCSLPPAHSSKKTRNQTALAFRKWLNVCTQHVLVPGKSWVVLYQDNSYTLVTLGVEP